jgi:hypothetical protein
MSALYPPRSQLDAADLLMAVPVPGLGPGDPASRDESWGVRQVVMWKPVSEEDV